MEVGNQTIHDKEFLDKLRQIVLKNLSNEQFGVTKLSEEVNKSRSYLHRKLKLLKGQSISQFICEVRLKEAHKLLKDENLTISEVAYRVGFNNPSYFNKFFHNYFGHPPGKSRNYIAENESNIGNHNSNTRIKSKDSKKWFAWTIFGILITIIIVISLSAIRKSGKIDKEKSIAVLPFENLSSDEANQYFADGLVDDLLFRLSKINELKVISRTSSEMFRHKGDKSIREIAKILDVSHIIEGSVQREGKKIKIIIQLIDTKNDDHILSEKYSGDITEIFKLQSEIASQLVTELSPYLTNERLFEIKKNTTNNLKAFEYYTLAQVNYSNYYPSAFLESVKYFKMAVQEDSTYAPALLGLAKSYARMSAFYLVPHFKAARDTAVLLAKKTLELDKTMAYAHALLGTISWEIDCNIPAAEKEYKKAIKLNPNNSETYKDYAEFLNFLRKHDEARKYINKAILLDPFNFNVRIRSTRLYMDNRQYKEAYAENKICENIKIDHPGVLELYFLIHRGLKDEHSAYESFRKLGEKTEKYSVFEIDSVFKSSGIKGLLKLRISKEPIFIIKAHDYALLGEKENALNLLEAAYKANVLGPGELHYVGFANKELLSEPRYIALLDSLGLKDYFHPE